MSTRRSLRAGIAASWRILLCLPILLDSVQPPPVLRLPKSPLQASAHDDPKRGDKERKNGRSDDNQGPVWGGFPIRRHGNIHYLDNGAFPCLIEFCDFEFLRQQLEDGLLIFEVAEPAQEFHPGLGHPPFGHVEVAPPA